MQTPDQCALFQVLLIRRANALNVAYFHSYINDSNDSFNSLVTAFRNVLMTIETFHRCRPNSPRITIHVPKSNSSEHQEFVNAAIYNARAQLTIE